MTGEVFIDRLNSRSRLYGGGRVLSTDHCIALRVDPAYAARFETQVSLIVAANLLSRMTTNLAFDIPDVPLHKALPWQNKTLAQLIRYEVCLNRPDQHYQFRTPDKNDYVLNIGPKGGRVNVHSSGWFAFVGTSSSPLSPNIVLNPIGACLASIMAVTLLFDTTPRPITRNYVFDAFQWRVNCEMFTEYHYTAFPALGDLWFLGIGSVGSCALYFLSLATRHYFPTLIDMDDVQIENMDRSAIFRMEHQGLDKVEAARRFLSSICIHDVRTEACSFSDSLFRQERQSGEPDIFISAANEDDVRHTIEQSMPPIQIYATTGNAWQTTLFRHIPQVDACSCCVFPPEEHVSDSICGGGEVTDRNTGKKIDASLPFLSFMAGLMAAAEILKLSISGYPFTHNKVTFRASHKKKNPNFVEQLYGKRKGCVCQYRHSDIHQTLIAGSKYAHLSGMQGKALQDMDVRTSGTTSNRDNAYSEKPARHITMLNL
jgi:hypothetical protein